MLRLKRRPQRTLEGYSCVWKPTVGSELHPTLAGVDYFLRGGFRLHMIRKGQACWGAAGAKVCLLHRFILDLFAATN
jgi:hypothetical protein